MLAMIIRRFLVKCKLESANSTILDSPAPHQQSPNLIKQAQAYLPVVVIDDGSKDDTAAQAEKAGAEVVRQIPNQGKGAALMRGFRYALERGCAATVMLDADGQHDPDEIPKFLQAFEETGADLIIGQR